MSTAHCIVIPAKLEGITPLYGTETDCTAVWNFEQSLKAAWGVYPSLSNLTKCNYILDNLGKIACDEIRFYPKSDDPEELFNNLHKAFGDHRTWGQMLQQFTCLCQLPNETLRMFSHRVMNAWQAIERAQIQRGCQIVTSSLLVDVFVNGLNDILLKKLLSEDLFAFPNTSIYELREKAIRWDEINTVRKEPTNEDSGVSLCTEVTDHTNQQIEESLAHMCIKLDTIVNNIIAQASSFPKRRRRKKKRCTTKDKVTFDDQIHQAAFSNTSEVSLAQDGTVARSMSAHIMPAIVYNMAIEESTENDKSVVESQNELLVQKDETDMKETISVKSCDVWALYGDKGQTMKFLKEGGCDIKVSKADGDRALGVRCVELIGCRSSIEKTKILIQEECGITVFPSK